MRYLNNPLNIRYTGSKWLGLAGKNNGFCEFTHLEFGVRAAIYILKRTYKRWFGYISLARAISIFAPPCENDTIRYINYVEAKSGVGRDSIIWFCSQDEWYRIIKAMAFMESNTIISRDIFNKAYEQV